VLGRHVPDPRPQSPRYWLLPHERWAAARSGYRPPRTAGTLDPRTWPSAGPDGARLVIALVVDMSVGLVTEFAGIVWVLLVPPDLGWRVPGVVLIVLGLLLLVLLGPIRLVQGLRAIKAYRASESSTRLP
jgi:hypothetical protein